MLLGQLSGPRVSSFLRAFPPLTPSFFPSNKVLFPHSQTCYVTVSQAGLTRIKDTPAPPLFPSPSLLPPPSLPPVHLFSRTFCPRTQDGRRP